MVRLELFASSRARSNASERAAEATNGLVSSRDRADPRQLRLPAERGRVKVTVTRAGTPVTGAAVALSESSGRAVLDMGAGPMAVYGGASTGADGIYESGLLPAGAYHLRVTMGTAERRVDITIPADASTKDVTITL